MPCTMSMCAALGHWVACPLKEISRSPGVRVCNRESDIDKGLGSLEVEHQIDLPRGSKRISKPCNFFDNAEFRQRKADLTRWRSGTPRAVDDGYYICGRGPGRWLILGDQFVVIVRGWSGSP